MYFWGHYELGQVIVIGLKHIDSQCIFQINYLK